MGLAMATAIADETMILTFRNTYPNRVYFADSTGTVTHNVRMLLPTDGLSFAIGHLADEVSGGFSTVAMQYPNGIFVSNYAADGTRSQRKKYVTPDNYRVVGIADFNANGINEVVMMDGVSGKFRCFEIDAAGVASNKFTLGVNLASAFSDFAGYNNPIGVADADGDGHPDLLIQNASSFVRYAYFNGKDFTALSSGWLDPTTIPGFSSLRGFTDLDGDGYGDIFHVDGNLRTFCWYMKADVVYDHKQLLAVPHNDVGVVAIGK
jgi:hypothetical protein